MAALLLALCLCPPAGAVSFNSIEIAVELRDDGSAHVTEVWDMSATNGTEMYLVQENLDGGVISNLSVSDETGLNYINEGSWDVDRSLEEKAGRCGMVETSGGYELCWGLGSYGAHVFTVSYDVTRFVKGFDDYCGFNRRLVNDQLSNSVASVTINIFKDGVEFTSEEVKIWAFGFTGNIWVTDGQIEVNTEDSIEYSNYINVLARFPRDMFSPELTESGSFEELRAEAFIGSDYESSEGEGGAAEQRDESSYDYDSGYYGDYEDSSSVDFESILAIVMGLACPLTVIIPIFVVLKNKNRNKTVKGLTSADTSDSDIDYWRELPYEGSLPLTRFALQNSGEKAEPSQFIGAYILRWAREGALKVRQVPKLGLFGRDTGKTQAALEFIQSPGSEDGTGLRLWNIIRTAAGEDKLLEAKEFTKWMRANYEKFFELLEDADNLAKKRLADRGDLVKEDYKVLGIFKAERFHITDAGKLNIRRMLGFKKFLKDFTIINEREPVEVALWGEYLVFASLFGIAEEVARQFHDIYPEFINECGVDDVGTFILINSFSADAARAASSARAAASSDSFGGGGGSSSGGGGGGFSGGGSGGGVR
ncbi:MAG: DUF2207 domain-containing protein [Oscillospiraceae bacterium]|nr:DUF2207 domain-containing protein [Oscillospiraceae bacterium]